MLSHLFFSFRLLSKNRLYAAISVLGLAVGISCCILISLYVKNELSYDNFHPEKEKIYRVTTVAEEFNAGLTSYGIGPTLKKDNKEVVSFCRYMSFGKLVDVKNDDIQFNEKNILLADSSFLYLFGFKLIHGNINSALSNPKSIVLSKKLAYKYYGNTDPINKTILLNKKEYTITGIIENCPDNSDIQYSALVSMNSNNEKSELLFYKDWFRVVCYTYIKFDKTPNLNHFQTKLDDFTMKYVKPWGEENDTKQVDYYRIENIEAVHFDNTNDFDTPKGNINYIYIFSGLALFVLLIASINYINLTLAQSTSRSKEIGVKKTLGADAFNIKIQFYTETLIITIIAFFISLILIELILPFFNEMTLKSFYLSDLISSNLILYLIILLIIITAISGFYPALVLSKFKPIEVFKGGGRTSKRSIGLVRKILLTVQFIFSISMIMSSTIIYNQMTFMKNKELGYENSNVYVFRIPNNDSIFVNKLEDIRNVFHASPSVKMTSINSSLPNFGYGDVMFRVEKDNMMIDAQLKLMGCDENFIDILNIKLLEGENFNNKTKTDSIKHYLINGSTAKKFGWSNLEALGKRLQWGLLPNGKAEYDGVVIGLIKDFNYQSLHNQIDPLVIQYTNNKNYMCVNIDGDNALNDLSTLKKYWQKELDGRIMDSFFLDQNFNSQYEAETRMLKVFNYFSLVSIILSALGLFALTSYMIKQKNKEIGIRKVLGASSNNIIFLLSKSFLILMFIGLFIAVIPTYYFINEWLNTFSYRVELTVIPIIIASVITFTMILLIVFYHVITLLNYKPIEALKLE